MKIKLLFLVIILATFFLKCTSDVYNADICFQENVLPIFVSKCGLSGCHNKKNDYDLTNYDGILKGVVPYHPLQSEIYNKIKGKNPEMPPVHSTQLSQKEVSYIKIWIKMGAKNSSNCSACDTTLYSYSGKIKPLLDLWCVGCHSQSTPGGGYDFSNYTTTIIPVKNGSFLSSLQHIGGYSPMPKNADKLPQCDIDAIQKWVNSGYPNN